MVNASDLKCSRVETYEEPTGLIWAVEICEPPIHDGQLHHMVQEVYRVYRIEGKSRHLVETFQSTMGGEPGEHFENNISFRIADDGRFEIGRSFTLKTKMPDSNDNQTTTTTVKLFRWNGKAFEEK